MVDSVHRMEMKYREQLMSEREAIRNELHLEHAQKEQELLHQMRQMRERETRERDQQQYRIAELQKSFRERANQLEAKERELREREAREKERLATLERQKEKEMRAKLQQELEQNLKEKEMREKKILEEQAELLKAQEKAILEKEQRLKEREEKMREEAKRRQKEEQDKKERDREEEEKMRSNKRQYEFSSQAPSSKRPAMDDGRVFNRIAGASPIVKETHISPNLTYRRFEKNSGGRMQPHMGVEPAVMGVAGMFNQNQATRGKPADIPTSSNKFMHNYHTPGPTGATPYRLGTPPVGYGSTNTSSANVPSPAATSYPLPPTTTASNTVSHNVAELLRHNPELYSKAMQALNSMSGHGGAGYSHPYGGRLTSPYSSADLYQQQQQSSRYMNPGAASGGYKRNAREGGAHRISGQSIRGGPTHPYKRSN
jgi:chemotaxis protein histidine kinase CheA